MLDEGIREACQCKFHCQIERKAYEVFFASRTMSSGFKLARGLMDFKPDIARGMKLDSNPINHEFHSFTHKLSPSFELVKPLSQEYLMRL